MRRFTLVLAGALFAAGLVISGMTQPQKVMAFLDFFGNWDPSLAFVMASALVVHAVAYRKVTKRQAPLSAKGFSFPTLHKVTPRLVMGAGLFGLGWGLGGFCPGPAISSLLSGNSQTLIFVGTMITGMFLAQFVERRVAENRKLRAPQRAEAVGGA